MIGSVHVAFLCSGVSLPCSHHQRLYDGNLRKWFFVAYYSDTPWVVAIEIEDSRRRSFIRPNRTAWFDVGRWAFSMTIVVGIMVGSDGST